MACIYNTTFYSSKVKTTFTKGVALQNETKQLSLYGDFQWFYLYRCVAIK